ncbi:hypothetical protein DFP72DRAFT_928776 [Ephemerocybe angulata]|uniref:RNA polymerase II-associated protein 3 n=1 Tax=Ephemerocybe angulata TaxID=980116 RepID=A0A8H6LVR5_9AGAR|nr:hypothetical protein DFP72DRAFT_928776 [Tulosesus angulatus]
MSKAQTSKEKGNEAFKAGKYADAVGYYTSAILEDRTEPTYPLNRAAAYLKLGKYEDAERDCTAVLALKPSRAISAKALFRRGQAKAGMDKVPEAKDDYDAAHKFAPGDVNIQNAINAVIEREEEKLKKAAASTRARAFEVDPMSPPRRRRVPIEIVGSATPAAVPATKAPPASLTPSARIEEVKTPSQGAGLKAVSSRPLPPSPSSSQPSPNPTPTASSSNTSTAKKESPAAKAEPPKPQPVARAEIQPISNEKPSSFKEAKQTRDNVRPSRVGGGVFRVSGPSKIFPTREVDEVKKEGAAASTSPPRQDAATAPSAPRVKAPATFSELVKLWGMQKTPQDRWALLSTIQPSKFPSFCKDSLEPVFLVSIFQTIHDVLETADLDTQIAIKSFLEFLPIVPRFNTIYLFLSKSEKAVVREVWNRLGIEAEEMEGIWAALLKQ